MHRNDKSSLPFGNLGMNNMMNMNMNMNLLKMGSHQEKDAPGQDGNPKSQIQEPGPQGSSIMQAGALGLNNLGNLMPIGSAEQPTKANDYKHWLNLNKSAYENRMKRRKQLGLRFE